MSLLDVVSTEIFLVVDIVLEMKKVLLFEHMLQNSILIQYYRNIRCYFMFIHCQIWYNNNYCINLLYFYINICDNSISQKSDEVQLSWILEKNSFV